MIIKRLYLNLIILLLFEAIVLFIAYFSDQFHFIIKYNSYLFLIVLYFILYKTEQGNLKSLLGFGFFVRLTLVFADCLWQNDSLRVIWDGIAVAKGINPYADVPLNILENPKMLVNKDIHELNWNLKSLAELSFTGPVKTYIGAVNSFLFGTNPNILITVFRLEIIICEFFLLSRMKKIAQFFNLGDRSLLIWYLNPFVIIIPVLSISFISIEIIMLIHVIYYFLRKKYFKSSFIFSLAVLINPFSYAYIFFLIKRKSDHLKEIFFSSFIIILLFVIPFFKVSIIVDYYHFLLNKIKNSTHFISDCFDTIFFSDYYLFISLLFVAITSYILIKFRLNIFVIIQNVSVLMAVLFPFYNISFAIIGFGLSFYTKRAFPLIFLMFIYLLEYSGIKDSLFICSVLFLPVIVAVYELGLKKSLLKYC